MKSAIKRNSLSFPCPHADRCPGCTWEQKHPSAVDELRRFFLPWNLSVPYVEGPEIGWRSRAKLASRANATGGSIGLFRAGSHEIVDISHCHMHTPALNRALEVCRRHLCKEKRVSLYNEATHTGDLRYILFSEETHSSKVSVVFVLNLGEESDTTKRWIGLSTTLMKEYPSLFHSFWLNFQQEATNTICGKASRHVIGEIYQWERIKEVWLPFHPLHFRQANMPLFSLLLEDLEKTLPAHTHIIDLFGGMGAIGLSLCHKARKVECVEIDASAQKSFEEARQRLPLSLQQIISFHCLSCNAEEIAAILHNAETVLVDPPRKGLSHALIERLSKSPATTLAYISCCAETLLQNVTILLEKGWIPVFAKAYQFFPRTEHIESLVVLQRSSLP